jgi:dual specificity tyrosine-phosphorylation-regulated kinase 2/3/4
VVLGLPYDAAVDMWSFGCIISEMVTGKPLFPAIDENELLELMVIRIGMPPQEMINNCKKRRQFFDLNGKLIRSRKSRVPRDAQERSEPVSKALFWEKDNDFLDFIEVSVAPPWDMAPQFELTT